MLEKGSGAFLMFENRLKKLKKDREKWSKKENIFCYRVYSEDIPQIPVILDFYPNGLVLFDKSSLRHQTEEEKEQRFLKIQEIVASIYPNVPIYLKNRKKQKGKEQYIPLSREGATHWILESDLQFKVNLSDYLDTGLFLDHRITRKWIRERVKDKSFLNLFCYTGAFTVYAAKGGASFSTSIDLSKTYLDWAKDNLDKNQLLSSKHQFIEADVLFWLERESKNPNRTKYDLIFIDPPTFSNSKKMNEEWDVQSKHRNTLLLLLTKFLNDGGEIWFSTNFRQFKMEVPEAEWKTRDYRIEDLSEPSIPEDFRDKKIHKLYKIFPL
ncbi:MAG: class I SAM-dependent methyltransferase [Leptospira sp.]|nr:class I SAM-dependent methyltransferase [Leptospira sp.]